MKDFSALKEILDDSRIAYSEKEYFSSISTFRVGGKIALTIFPGSDAELISVLDCLRNSGIEPFVAGRCSNILPDDDTYDGVVIKTDKVNRYYAAEDTIYAQCGLSTNKLCAVAMENSIDGFTDFYGIPGSVGGLLHNNGGAFGSSAEDIFVRGAFYDFDSGKMCELTREDMCFSYRNSILMSRRMFAVSAVFKGKPGRREDIAERMSRTAERRRETQPLEYPSAGSVFLRPEGDFAGRLIEECGLKGCSVGGAEVSVKHAGFIVNKGGATSSDIRTLIDHIKKTVYERFGVMLRCEIDIL